MEKGKIIFIGVLGVVFLLAVIYTVNLTSKKSSTVQATDFTAPIMTDRSQAEAKEDYNSRLANANRAQETDNQQSVASNMDFKTYSSDSAPKVKEDPRLTSTAEAVEGRRTATRAATPRTSAKVEQPAAPKSEAAPAENDPGGFGISVQKTVESRPAQEVASTRTSGFFPAVPEEDTKIKNQSSVVFFLLKDCTVSGIDLKKNAVLYGKAVQSGGVFNIYITQVMNTDGKMYSLSNVVVYDEKFSRGLPVEGNLNEAMRESTSQTTNDAASNIASSATGSLVGSGVNLAVSALDNTVRAINQKKEPTIDLMQGYKVYIKQE